MIGADAGALPLFAFERDLYPSLHCIPMAARYKLDVVGVKVPLKAWNRLPLSRRVRLLCHDSVETPAERGRLRAELCAWLGQVSEEPVRFLPFEELPSWEETDRLAPAVTEQAAACHPPLSVGEWAALGRLERFALVKLATTKHERGRFAAALAEFRRVSFTACARWRQEGRRRCGGRRGRWVGRGPRRGPRWRCRHPQGP